MCPFYTVHLTTVELDEIRPKVDTWRTQLARPPMPWKWLDVHVYKYIDVIGTGPVRQLCTVGRISVNATVCSLSLQTVHIHIFHLVSIK